MATIEELQAEIRGLEGAVDYWRNKAGRLRVETMQLREEIMRMHDALVQQQTDIARLAEEKAKALERTEALTEENRRLTVDNDILRRRLDEKEPRDTIPGFHRTYAQCGKGEWRYWAQLPDGKYLWYPVWVPDEDAEELDNE